MKKMFFCLVISAAMFSACTKEMEDIPLASEPMTTKATLAEINIYFSAGSHNFQSPDGPQPPGEPEYPEDPDSFIAPSLQFHCPEARLYDIQEIEVPVHNVQLYYQAVHGGLESSFQPSVSVLMIEPDPGYSEVVPASLTLSSYVNVDEIIIRSNHPGRYMYNCFVHGIQTSWTPNPGPDPDPDPDPWPDPDPGDTILMFRAPMLL